MEADVRRRRVVWIGCGLLVAGFALDLHLDVRARDLFSWMDPYQYYDFALGVVEERERFDGFEIPSLFPFLVMPLLLWQPGVPAALWVNAASMLLLVAGVHGLCRELGVRTPSPLVAALVLSSPLLLGLSRTLYVEFTLTAIACVVFVAWLRFLRAPNARNGLLFGTLFGLGYLTKTTFPLFLAAPLAGAVIGRLPDRRDEALLFVAAGILPVTIALAIHALVFAPSLGYYLNLVSTTLPFMYLMGPPDAWSWASAAYYVGEVGRTFLWLLTPLLALAAWTLWRRAGPLSLRDLAGPQAALWLWLCGPLVLLVAHPLKEPRHVAPCAVPALLLIVLGLEAVRARRARAALLAAAFALAIVQYAAVTTRLVPTPYFMDRPLHYAEIREAMRASSRPAPLAHTPPGLRSLHWRYDQNVAIAGFPANEALALTWQGFPGVAYDLDTFDDPGRFTGSIAFDRFEDLFFLAAINTYNRRCGWTRYHPTLPREAVVANADFVLLNEPGEPDGTSHAEHFPDHVPVATIDREDGRIRVLRARGATRPYRALYARRFLARNEGLSQDETRVVAQELLLTAVLAGDAAEVRALLRELPLLRESGATARNIYWIGGYPALLELARARLAAMQAPDRGASAEEDPEAPRTAARGRAVW